MLFAISSDGTELLVPIDNMETGRMGDFNQPFIRVSSIGIERNTDGFILKNIYVVQQTKADSGKYKLELRYKDKNGFGI